MVLVKSFVLAALAAIVTAKSAVIDLVPDNFDEIVLTGKPALVEFFAPWCGHCKTLAPVYEELAGKFAGSTKVSIAKVDADAEKSLGKRFGIKGFPTIKYFDGKSETPEDYNGGRDLESLTKFISEKVGAKPAKKAPEKASNVDMLTDASFGQKIGKDQDALVAFTAPWCGHCKTLAPVWEELANDFQNEAGVLIAKVDAEGENSKATAKEQGVSSYPTIKFFPKGSSIPVEYQGGRTEADFVKFLNDQSGTHRTTGGGLDATAGTIEALDSIVAKFTGGATLAEVAAEAAAKATELGEAAQYQYAKYYVRVFEKLSKSDTYAAKELKRLDGLMQKGGLAPAKLDEFTSKTNILKRYIEKATTGKSEL